MRNGNRLVSAILVLAMVISFGSCAQKERELESARVSEQTKEDFKKLYDLMTGSIGMNYYDVLDRISKEYNLTFDTEGFTDVEYFSDEEGYYDYIYNRAFGFGDVQFNQIEIFCNPSDGMVFHIGFINNLLPADELDENYEVTADICTDYIGRPKGTGSAPSSGDGTAFTEFGLGEGNTVSTGRYISEDYNSHWFDITNWLLSDLKVTA
jgi:hypothetical protein